MHNYSYFYIKSIADDDGNVKTHKFQTGNTALHGLPVDDVWSTSGRYRLTSRLLRGGLSGSGDIFHPGNAVFKIIYQRLTTDPRPIFNVFGVLPEYMYYTYTAHLNIETEMEYKFRQGMGSLGHFIFIV